MSIDAVVKTVIINENGSGHLILEELDKHHNVFNRTSNFLNFDKAPEEVTALNGLRIWCGQSIIMLGDIKIAARKGYTNAIEFCPNEEFKDAVSKYHQKTKNI